MPLEELGMALEHSLGDGGFVRRVAWIHKIVRGLAGFPGGVKQGEGGFLADRLQ